MRQARVLAIAALVAIASVASSAVPALAAAETQTYRESFRHVDDHQNGEMYVFDVDLVFHLTVRPDGVSSASVTARQVQTHLIDGKVIDVIESNTVNRTLVDGEEPVVMHASGHHRYESDGERCQTTIVWHLVDGDVVVDLFKSVCPD